MLDEFKTYLASAAQVPGQAVLSFNQRVEELLRESRPDPAVESPSGRPRQAVDKKAPESDMKNYMNTRPAS